jgi:prepilin-type N-terminal cleavage/methylation domain-containing protein
MLNRRLAGEAGFTIIELLVAMTVGLVVLAAALLLVGKATQLTTTTQDRVDAVQRGRHGLERMLTELRSGVCVLPSDGSPVHAPLISADGTRVEFYANLGTENALPQRRVLSYDGTNRAIVEESYDGSYASGSTSAMVVPFTANPRTETLLDNVVPAAAGAPIFKYFEYTIDATGTQPKVTGTDELTVPVAAARLANVVQVDVAFRVRPTNATADSRRDTFLQGSAVSRLADPLNALAGIPCT